MSTIEIRTPVNLIITNDKEEVLLIRRASNKKLQPLMWSIPGGNLEEGETVEKGLIREIYEELNVKIVNMKFWKSYYIKLFPTLHARPLYFYGKIRGNIKINKESCDWGWFTYNKFKDIDLAFEQKPILEDFYKFLKGIKINKL